MTAEIGSVSRWKCTAVFLVAVVLFRVHGCSKGERAPHPPLRVGRIVSLAPSITETLFALGLGKKLVAVTSYCVYPPQTAAIEKIGGYADANIERIVAVHPDLVVLSSEHEKQRISLERFSVPTLTVDHSTCASLCSSFISLGRICGVNRTADSLVALFTMRLNKKKPDTQALLKVLLCVGRDAPGAGTIKSVFVAGRSTFYNDLILAAGARNAFPDSVPAYPKLSPEGILALAPDVIIDVAPAMGSYACSLLVWDWQKMGRVPAVANGRVHCMSSDYAAVPGPRLLLLLDDIEDILGTSGKKGLQ
ncbi:MAG: ABC transporter substrate-binding protein [Chitinispirillaceae bacterium]|nr:ABC transporter substrate-binding protein [Chitinispirillaceae bacterium]